jgi:hypothetical protein
MVMLFFFGCYKSIWYENSPLLSYAVNSNSNYITTNIPISSAIVAKGLLYHHNILLASILMSTKFVRRANNGANGSDAANNWNNQR